LLCFVLLTISRAVAQETFAPLITENCVAFIHVDFRKVEVDTVRASLQKAGEDFMKGLAFDDRSFKATARELTVELEKLDILVRPHYEKITKELGITELAVIADLSLLEKGIYSVLVAPWKGKTDEDLQKLLAFMPESEYKEAYLSVGDFLFVAFPNFSIIPQKNPLAEKQILAEWIKNAAENKDAPILAALKSVSDAEIKIAITAPDQVRTMLKTAPLPPDVPLEVRNFLLYAAQKIQWVSASISLSDLLGGDPSKNANVLMTVKMAKPADARMIYGLLESLIDLSVNAAQFGMKMQEELEFDIPPLAFQFGKGMLRTFLPDVEDDMLVFRVKGDFGVGGLAQAHMAISVAGTGVALLLPAVQAAREAARRMQCLNHIKQIVFAIHNFHDARNALPPLYTVDANGKPLHSWRVHILPYIEQVALYEMIRRDEPWDSEHNKQFHDRMPAVYVCPSNPNQGCTYVGIAGEGFTPAKVEGRERTFAAIADGLSNTLMIIEVKEGFCWMDPTADITLDELVKGINVGGRAGSFHPGGCNIGMFDGSVRFLQQTVDKASLRALGTIAGGEAFAL